MALKRQAPNIVPTDQASIFQALVSLQSEDPVSYNAIVRPNNPPLGIGGYLFDIPGDEEVRLKSQITTYFLEDNTSVQDNIAVEPAIITLRGMVAELTLGIPLNPPTTGSTTVNPLVPALMPQQTPQQAQDYAIATAQAAQQSQSGQAQAAANGTSQSLYAYYQNLIAGNTPGINRQTTAFLYFQQLQTGQQLCSVETPWGIYEQCGILDVRILQDEKTKGMSEFSVTFQEMRFAGDATVSVDNYAGRTALQQAPTTQDGNAGQTPVTPSAFSGILNKMLLNSVNPVP